MPYQTFPVSSEVINIYISGQDIRFIHINYT